MNQTVGSITILRRDRQCGSYNFYLSLNLIAFRSD
jgi:hypothetical protein